ncbi:MAG TPA: type II toxin-antitoxin system HicB family antitoxin [Phycisphaerae bacterium]|nr:type II toxin-antitoxin system HicB family antitoxin [Phycisphaerae bacterium]
MSVKLENSKLNRPFSKNVLAQAKKIADRYKIVLSHEDGDYIGHGLEMPLVMADGKTAKQCVANTHDALVAAVATMIEHHEPVPAPTLEAKRTEQVNVRLTREEKMLLESSAKRKGFEGISDFLRVAALKAT